jgi:flagellar basal-body rod protein FlgF
VLFTDWLATQNGTDGSRGNGPVAFVQDRGTYRDKAQGALQHTGNPLDLAIGGDGFFTVDTPRGPRLTRAGRFAPQPDGKLTDSNGNALLDTTGQPLRISPADVNLVVTADGAIASENGQIGRIGIVQPGDLDKMTAEGGTVLRADSPTTAVAQPAVIQGAVEDSNVQPIVEMTRMMASMRSFQFTAQLVEAEATRQQSAIDKLTQTKG